MRPANDEQNLKISSLREKHESNYVVTENQGILKE